MIVVQVILLLVTTFGWGYLLHQLVGLRTQRRTRFDFLFFGFGGYAANILFLQGLTYAGVPLRISSWIGLAIAGVGIFLFFRTARRKISQAASDIRVTRIGAVASVRGKDFLGVIGIAFFVFASQGAPLLFHGPDNYYGNAQIDQVNYVLTAQFLVEHPFSTGIDKVDLHPWLLEGITKKTARIGQYIANGYLAVVSLTDAKSAYGVASISMLCFAAAATFALARLLGMSNATAFLTSAWWALLPNISRMHLDGFFSQTTVLFVFPAMAGLFRSRNGKLDLPMLLLQSLYLAFLLSSYTELYVPGLASLCALVTFAAERSSSVKKRVLSVSAMLFVSVLLTSGYAKYLFQFIKDIYRFVMAGDPLALAHLAPVSGTWAGWERVFFGELFARNLAISRSLTFLSVCLVFVGVAAWQSQSLTRNRLLLAMVAPPLGLLTLLITSPEVPKYAFSKLINSFTPFWIIIIVIGLSRISLAIFRKARMAQTCVCLIILCFCGGAAAASWGLWRAVFQDEGYLKVINSPAARACYREAKKNPAATYIVVDSNSIFCAWLAYATRKSPTFIHADFITDIPISSSKFTFRSFPALTRSTIVLSDTGPHAIGELNGQPKFIFRNPQGLDMAGGELCYWLGPPATLEIFAYDDPSAGVARYVLEFEAGAGPANPERERELALIARDGSRQTFSFKDRSTVRFEVSGLPGKNEFTLEILHPLNQTVWQPTDSRNHMVRLDHVRVVPLQP